MVDFDGKCGVNCRFPWMIWVFCWGTFFPGNREVCISRMLGPSSNLSCLVDDVQLRRVYLRLALKYHPDKHPKAIWWWQDRLGKILGPQKGDKQYRIGGETSNIFSFSTLPAEMIQFDFCISFKKRGETTKNRFRFEFPFRIFGLLGWCELLVVCCSQGFRFRILGFSAAWASQVCQLFAAFFEVRICWDDFWLMWTNSFRGWSHL